MNAEGAEKYIIEELRTKLPDDLFYHGLHHTIDVMNAALNLAQLEGIEDLESLILLKTAALYHDAGFMNIYKNHEEAGCRIARNVLPDFEYTDEQIQAICGLIMATKIPQNPQNKLEKILCDADLDYLGRDDYEAIALTLFQEWKVRHIVSDKETWNSMQAKFLGSHQYWTKSARENRDKLKKMHLLAFS